MTTAAPAAETRPVTFAGIGEILVPDMRHREIFILGARLGEALLATIPAHAPAAIANRPSAIQRTLMPTIIRLPQTISTSVIAHTHSSGCGNPSPPM